MNNFNQQDFSNYTVLHSQPATGATAVSKKFMANVFLWMFVALGISTFFAVVYAMSPGLFSELYTQTERGLRPSMLGYIVMFAPLGLALIIGAGYNKLSVSTLTLLYISFSAVLGISLSHVLVIFTSGSVIGCFGSAAAMFGVMAFMGYTTEKDLSSFGRILMMGAIGIFFAIIINMFLASPALNYLISIIGVAVFTGLTAYDVQKLKRIGAGLEYDGVSANDTKKLALIGGMNLYLDFVNMFLFLLQLFGNRRD